MDWQPPEPGNPGYQQPGASYQPGPPYQSGPSHQPGMPTEPERTWSLGAHLGPFLIGFIAPLVVYLVKGPESEFIKFQSREALNFQIMMLIGWIAATVLTVVFIGFALFAVLIVFHFVFPIMAAVKSNTGEPYRYPVSIRFIS